VLTPFRDWTVESPAYLHRPFSAIWQQPNTGISGNRLWIMQLGIQGGDYASKVSVDGAGSAYSACDTFGSLGGTNAGESDVFLAKYDTNGNLVWINQLGNKTIGRRRACDQFNCRLAAVMRAPPNNVASD